MCVQDAYYTRHSIALARHTPSMQSFFLDLLLNLRIHRRARQSKPAYTAKKEKAVESSRDMRLNKRMESLSEAVYTTMEFAEGSVRIRCVCLRETVCVRLFTASRASFRHFTAFGLTVTFLGMVA